MQAIEIGNLVCSKAGHDKGTVYIVVSVDKDFLYLIDGKYKTLSKPKKKRSKHVERLEEQLLTISEKTSDVECKRAIKLWKQAMNVKELL